MLFLLLPNVMLEWVIVRGPRDLVYYAVLVAVLISLNLAAIVDQLEREES